MCGRPRSVPDVFRVGRRSLPEASQEPRTRLFASAPVLVLPCPSRICAAGVSSPAPAPAAEVVTSGFPRLRTTAAAALAAAASIATPASLRQGRRRGFAGSSRRAAEDSRGRDLGCDAVLQDLPRVLDLRRRPGARFVHAAPRSCPGAPGNRSHSSRNRLHLSRRLERGPIRRWPPCRPGGFSSRGTSRPPQVGLRPAHFPLLAASTIASSGQEVREFES